MQLLPAEWDRLLGIANLLDRSCARRGPGTNPSPHASPKYDARPDTQGERLQRLDCSAINLESFIAGSADSPSECAMRREDSLVLADAIASLPDDYREIIMLRTFQGLSFDEAAASMDRTAGALRMLWMRALESVRTRLHESHRHD